MTWRSWTECIYLQNARTSVRHIRYQHLQHNTARLHLESVSAFHRTYERLPMSPVAQTSCVRKKACVTRELENVPYPRGNCVIIDTEGHQMPTCSCESSWCHKGEQRARWLQLPDNCCPVGSRLNTWPQPADRRTLSGRSVPQSAYCSPVYHTVWSNKHNGCSSSSSDVCESMTLLSGIWPDGSILCGAPESVGPHGSCGDAFDSVGVVRKHMDGFFHRQVVHMDLRVSCTCYQNSISRVRKEL